jgi:hypothetical protein
LIKTKGSDRVSIFFLLLPSYQALTAVGPRGRSDLRSRWALGLRFEGPKSLGPSVQVAAIFNEVCYWVFAGIALAGACIGLPVVWQGRKALRNDSWVSVTGHIGWAVVNGARQPAIVATMSRRSLSPPIHTSRRDYDLSP